MPIAYGSNFKLAPLSPATVSNPQEIKVDPFKYEVDWSEFNQWWNPLAWGKDIITGIIHTFGAVGSGLEKFFQDPASAFTKEAWNNWEKPLTQAGLSFIPVVGPIASGLWVETDTISGAVQQYKQTGDLNGAFQTAIGGTIAAGAGVAHGVRAGIKNIEYAGSLRESIAGKYRESTQIREAFNRDVFKPALEQARAPGSTVNEYFENYQPAQRKLWELQNAEDLNRTTFQNTQQQLDGTWNSIKNTIRRPDKAIRQTFQENLKTSIDLQREVMTGPGGYAGDNPFVAEGVYDQPGGIGQADVQRLTQHFEAAQESYSATSQFAEFGGQETLKKMLEDIAKKFGDNLQKRMAAYKQLLDSIVGRTYSKFMTQEQINKMIGAIEYRLYHGELQGNWSGENASGKIAKLSNKVLSETYKYGQMIQSPSTAAAAVLDRTYGRAMESAEAVMDDIKVKGKGEPKAKKLVDAKRRFEESGGKVVNSEWIMGYKVIADEGFQLIVQISFNEWATMGTAKNKSGKLPVYAKLSRQQFDAWEKAHSKGRWYIDNIARSRGGRSELLEFGFSQSLLGALTFLPVAQIQQIIGVATIVKNLATGKMDLPWTKQFANKFADTFKEEVGEMFKDEVVKYSPGKNNVLLKAVSRSTIKGTEMNSQWFGSQFTQYNEGKMEEHGLVGAQGQNVQQIKTMTPMTGQVRRLFS